MQDLVDLTLTAAAGAFLVWALIGIVQRRWKRGTLCSLVALGLAVWVVRYEIFVPQPRNVLDASKLDLLKKGMTPAEVESLFGMPPGCYGHPAFRDPVMLPGFTVRTKGTRELDWFDDFKRFELFFDSHDRLVAWQRCPCYARILSPSGTPGLQAKIKRQVKDLADH